MIIQKLKEHSGTILAVASCVGVIFTAYRSAQDTPKALKRLEDAKEKKGEELTKTEKFVAMAPAYASTIITAGATCATMLASDAISRSQRAKLSAMCVGAAETLRKYEKKTDELYGEGASKEVKKEVMKEEVAELNKNAKNDGRELYYLEGYGYFRATEAEVAWGYANFFRMLQKEGSATMLELAELILDKRVKYNPVAEDIGWTLDYLLEYFADCDLVMDMAPDLVPGVKVIVFDRDPFRNFSKWGETDIYSLNNQESSEFMEDIVCCWKPAVPPIEGELA